MVDLTAFASVNVRVRGLIQRTVDRGSRVLQARFERSRFAADAIACSKQAASEIRDLHMNRSQASELRVCLAEWPRSRYDEAIVSLGFVVRSMNFDLKLVPQIFFSL